MKNCNRFILFGLIMSFLLSVLVLPQKVANTGGITFADTAEQNSVFIKKPTYSVFYNNNYYFIDSSDNLLKTYDIENKTFKYDCISVSNYTFVANSFVDGIWYFLAKEGNVNKIIKFDLTSTNVVMTPLDFQINDDFKNLSVQNIEFNSKDYILFALSSKDVNTKLFLLDKDDSTFETIDITFNQNLEQLSDISTKLVKVLPYQNNIGTLYLIFFYDSKVAYYTINNLSGLTELKTKTISSLTTTSNSLDTTDSDISIVDIAFAKINSDDCIAISYHDKKDNQDLIKIYSFILGSGTEFLTLESHYACENAKYMTFNKDYYSYVDSDNQKLYYTKIYYELDEHSVKVYKNLELSYITNPEYEIEYFSEENYVYKKAIKNTDLYDDPWGAEVKPIVAENNNVIKIGNAKIVSNSEIISGFDYCMFTYENKNYLGFIKSSDLQEKTAIDVSTSKYKNRLTVQPKTVLYSMPTTITKGFECKNPSDCTLNANAIKVIENNSPIEVLDLLCGYSANNKTLIKVKVNSSDVGYIDASKIIEPSTVVSFVKTNATVIGDNTIVYLSADKDSTQLDFKLNSGKNVRINGTRNTESGFTSITFNDEYGNEFSGYILTDYVKADTWTALQIIGSVLIAVNVGLLVLVLIFRRKRLGSSGQKLN